MTMDDQEPPENLGIRPLKPEIRVALHLRSHGSTLCPDGAIGPSILNTTRHLARDETNLDLSAPSTAPGGRTR